MLQPPRGAERLRSRREPPPLGWGVPDGRGQTPTEAALGRNITLCYRLRAARPGRGRARGR
jgi:hypothetical protein